MNKKRIPDVDVLRGIGIFCMVAGHIYFGMLFDKYIHAFHMPMFFIISGYFYKAKEENLHQIFFSLRDKAKSLLVPYAFFAFVAVVFWILFENPDMQEFKVGILSVLWTNTINFPVSGALWFLTVLFLVYALACFVHLIKPLWIKAVVLIGFMLLGSLWTTVFQFRLPFGLDVAFCGVVLFAFGYMVKNNFPQLLRLPAYIFIPGFVIVSVLSVLNGYINMRLANYAFIPLFWFNACFMTVILWNICRSVCSNITKFKFINIICKELEFVGKNSIVYLCLNQIVITITTKITALAFPQSSAAVVILATKLVVLFISMMALHFAVYIFGGKRGILIGKKL